MPDSPRCYKCLDLGLIGQTYKIAGKRKFKCASCKHIYDESEFKTSDFEWRKNPEEWKKDISKRLTKVGQNRVKEIIEKEFKK